MSIRILRGLALVLAIVSSFLLSAAAFAAETYDLDPDAIQPELPSVITNASSPVYITNNSAGVDTTGVGAVDTLRVGERSSLHMGYDSADVATGAVVVNVAGDVLVEGRVLLGKDATNGAPGLPNSSGANAVSLNAGGNLVVARGGQVVVNGVSDGDGTNLKHAVVSAAGVDIAGGTVRLEDYAELRATGSVASGTDIYSVRVRDGGSLMLNGGIPGLVDVREYDPDWVFKGLNVATGGGDVIVDKGGVLSSGSSGGVIAGAAGQRLVSKTGGMVDASAGNILVRGMDVLIEGGYRAGYDSSGDATRILNAESGRVTVGDGAALALSRDLARHLNTSGTDAFNKAVILEGKEVVLASGTAPVLQTGMGTYTTVLQSAEDTTSGATWQYLRLGSVENAVTGSGSDADRERFRQNMEGIWNPARLNRDMSDNIYGLTASPEPSVIAYGESGRMNQSVLEAFVDGRNQTAGNRVADDSLFQMYNAGAQWGVNTVALNTAGEFMAGLDRRVDRLGAEMDRLGEGWQSSSVALGSCANPDLRENRLWAGGFSRNEDASLDYGISGYKYRPRGFMTGYDKLFGSLAMGGAFAFGRGDYRDKASTGNDSEITSYSGGLYGAYHAQSGLNLSAFTVYSHLDNDLSDLRGGMRRTADHSSYAWSLGARTGYDMLMTDRLTLSPSAGLTRTRAVNRSHDEYLDGVGVLRVGEVRRDSTLLPVDVGVGYDVLRGPGCLLRLTGNVGYAYDFDDGGLDGIFTYEGLDGATPMAVANRRSGRSRYNLGAGLIFTSSRLDLGARYDYYHRSEQQTHQFQGNLGVKF